MFKFNFGDVDENIEKEDQPGNALDSYESKRIEVTEKHKERINNLDENDMIEICYGENITLSCLSAAQVILTLKREAGKRISDVLEAEKNHSDLVPGKYEGGLKIWECTGDMLNFLSQNANESFNNKSVLDLGCGAGVLGIVALLKGGSVTFQDYNEEVLELITIPNVLINVENTEKASFYSGDWGSFFKVISKNYFGKDEKCIFKKSKIHDKFDYILSCETIYNPKNYSKIYKIIKEMLKENGVCFIAAKKCYFGVGGSTQSFIEYLQKENLLNVETCWSLNEGVGREILRIRFQK